MRSEYREANKATTWIIVVVIIVVVLAAIGGVIAWAINVATADIRGEGDKVVIKESAENFIEAQAFFEDTYQDIIVSDKQINVAATAYALNQDDKTLQTNLTGVINHCLNVVGDYNAEARKYLSEDFRAADLPAQISDTDPDTDCKPDQSYE